MPSCAAKGLSILVSLAAILLIIAIGYSAIFYGSRTITEGEAYGFKIGQSRKQTYERAKVLLSRSKIQEIHTWPESEFHHPFSDDDIEEAFRDPSWLIIVNTNWWNNTIRLDFVNDKLATIYRHRQIGELP